MHTLAIIPARGGSKGIPLKNLRRVAGRPLLAYAVLAARQSQRVDRVVVSTDDARIAAVARDHGAEVVLRSAELAGDEASSESALLHAMGVLEEAGNAPPDILVFLQCTAPQLRPEDIDGTVDLVATGDADSAFAAVPFSHFLWRRGENGAAVAVNHDPGGRQRRQDRDGDYLEAGSVYAMRYAGFKQHRHRFFGRVALFPVDEERWVEVDEAPDLELADALITHRDSRAALEQLPRRPAALVMDFDGVLTDDRVLVLEDGREGVVCHRGDGMGLELLRGLPVKVAVLSRERNPVVAARCRKLEIEYRQGLLDKVTVLDAWLAENGVAATDTVFVGNDVNDLGCMARVGCAVAVADARPEVLRAADLRLTRPGGHGAIREITDLLRQRIGRGPAAEPAPPPATPKETTP